MLFQLGDFRSHSGAILPWKIDCDALTDADLDCLAQVALMSLPRFGSVEGIPRGGIRFAEHVRPHATSGLPLIVDDVCTTGASLESARGTRDALGLVIVARSEPPSWVTPLFTLHRRLWRVP